MVLTTGGTLGICPIPHRMSPTIARTINATSSISIIQHLHKRKRSRDAGVPYAACQLRADECDRKTIRFWSGVRFDVSYDLCQLIDQDPLRMRLDELLERLG